MERGYQYVRVPEPLIGRKHFAIHGSILVSMRDYHKVEFSPFRVGIKDPEEQSYLDRQATIQIFKWM